MLAFVSAGLVTYVGHFLDREFPKFGIVSVSRNNSLSLRYCIEGTKLGLELFACSALNRFDHRTSAIGSLCFLMGNIKSFSCSELLIA